MRLYFCFRQCWIEFHPDCTGLSCIEGVGVLPFYAPNEDDSSLLGSPFLPECPDLGYTSEYRAQANAEHEYIHLRASEHLLGVPSPNHRVLCEDVHDNETIIGWRTIEEQIVTGIQYYLNTARLTSYIQPWLNSPVRMGLFDDVVLDARQLRAELKAFSTSCRKFEGKATRKC